jgi:hypothetical protein
MWAGLLASNPAGSMFAFRACLATSPSACTGAHTTPVSEVIAARGACFTVGYQVVGDATWAIF